MPLHHFICRFHKHILVFTSLVTLAAISLTAHLKLDSNLFSLLPSDNKSVKTFFETTEAIGFQSILIALVEMPPGWNDGKCNTLVDVLGSQFVRSPLIHEVEYKSDEDRLLSLFQKFILYLPLFLKDGGLDQLAAKLSDAEIRRRVGMNKRLLTTPFSIAAEELVYSDPLGLRDLLAYSTTPPSGKFLFRSHEGYYRTQDGKTYFVFIRPKKPPQDVTFSKELMAEINSLERTSLAEFSSRFGNISEKIRISYAGGYPIAVNDEATSKRDIMVTILGSFFAVIFLSYLTFKTARIAIFVGVPLAISVLWTLGFARLLFQDLNVLTCVFSCVLIGLGIDFAIHIVNRYFDKENTRLDLPQRLAQTFEKAGMGIVVGAVTTAIAFYCIAISKFKGFQELGILTGTGILICLLVMLLVLPSLLIYFSRKEIPWKKPKMAGFGLEHSLGYLQKHAKLFLLIAFSGCCFLAIGGMRIRFDDNLKNFRPTDQQVFQLQDEVTDWLGGSTAEILLVVEGKSEPEVMETSGVVYDALNELKESGVIAGVKSISRFIMAPSRQNLNRKHIEERRDVFDIERVRKTFIDALDEQGFEKIDEYDEYFESLAKALETQEVIVPSMFEGTKLEDFVKMFVFQKGKVFKTITYVVPSIDLWSRDGTKRLKEQIIQHLSKKGVKRARFTLTGANLLTADLKELIIKGLKSSMWLASLAIIAILSIYYRKVKLITLAVLPVTLGLVMTIGTMAIFRIDFNFFNLIVLPMIVGIGIDDGVHLTNTFCRSRNGNMLSSMSQTARAVVLTSLTTMAGFGSIALSHYPGLRSMGYVAVIGVSACMVASIAIFPTILAIIKPSNRPIV